MANIADYPKKIVPISSISEYPSHYDFDSSSKQSNKQGVPLISTGVGKNFTFFSPLLKKKGPKKWCFFTPP